MSQDEIRLVIPAEEEFRPIAHLVTGGLAARHDLVYDDLEDLQVALEAVLALRDDEGELTVVLAASEAVLRVSLGPFATDALQAEDEQDGGELDLQRVLETVCDTHEVERRDDGLWFELTKQLSDRAEAGR